MEPHFLPILSFLGLNTVMVLPVNEYSKYKTLLDLGGVMVSFRSDCREGFVISVC